MNRKPLIIIAGPTAIGKTKLSIELAKEIGGEIISADSMQVYRRMNIGSAKITKDEMQGVPHYLIDILEPSEDFDVVSFQKQAKKAMSIIYQNGHTPILVGGTGFYIQSLLYDIDFSNHDEGNEYRLYLEGLVKDHGVEYLHSLLSQKDPEAAMQIHPNNVKRVIRALEFYEENGTKISAHNEIERSKSSPYKFRFFVLTDDREKLYNRIEERVDIMVDKGLLNEVKSLKKEGLQRNSVSMQGLGYKEILSFLDEEITLNEAITLIKKNTRHFAKRQITWFKREKDVLWINKSDYNNSEREILAFLTEESLKCINEER